MLEISRYVATGAMLLWASLATAQTPYENMEVGTVVKDGIGRGTFQKPIPLPEGEWLVVSKRVEELEFTRGDHTKNTQPQYVFTLKNTHAEQNPIYAMIVRMNPEALFVNWGNGKCESNNPMVLADDFGYTPNSPLYVCALSMPVSGFKRWVAASVESKKEADRLNFSALAGYPDDIFDDTLWVEVWGNKYRGTAMGYSFLIKRTSNFVTDAAYTSYVKDWVHATGLALGETLLNNKASIAPPAPYPVQ